jgi:hypothetical protein
MSYFKIGKDIVWTDTYNWCESVFANQCIRRGVDQCGNSFPDKLGMLVRITKIHVDSIMELIVGTNI